MELPRYPVAVQRGAAASREAHRHSNVDGERWMSVCVDRDREQDRRDHDEALVDARPVQVGAADRLRMTRCRL